MLARGWPLILGGLCLTGCVVEVHSGPTRHDFREFERKGVDRLRLDLHMGAGEVKIRGGATQLARADFTYNVDAWKPEVTYHTLGGTSDLSIEQPTTVTPISATPLTTGTSRQPTTFRWS